jgi:hypothetical protein
MIIYYNHDRPKLNLLSRMARKESIMEQQTQLPITEIQEALNVTPHTVGFFEEDSTPLLEVPSTGLARVSATTSVVGYLRINGVLIPQTHTEYGEIEGLPEPQEGRIIIVSGMIISALAQQGIHRTDLFVPGMQLRDEQGRVIGCRSLDN